MSRCPSLLLLAVLASVAGTATLALASPAAAPEPARHADAMQLPTSAPSPDAHQGGLWGWTDSRDIAARMSRPQPAGTGNRSVGRATAGAATVEVTAVVLPVVTLVVRDGRVAEAWTNTPDRDPLRMLFAVRQGSIDGQLVTPPRHAWADARRILARANAGTGRVAGA